MLAVSRLPRDPSCRRTYSKHGIRRFAHDPSSRPSTERHLLTCYPRAIRDGSQGQGIARLSGLMACYPPAPSRQIFSVRREPSHDAERRERFVHKCELSLQGALLAPFTNPHAGESATTGSGSETVNVAKTRGFCKFVHDPTCRFKTLKSQCARMVSRAASNSSWRAPHGTRHWRACRRWHGCGRSAHRPPAPPLPRPRVRRPGRRARRGRPPAPHPGRRRAAQAG